MCALCKRGDPRPRSPFRCVRCGLTIQVCRDCSRGSAPLYPHLDQGPPHCGCIIFKPVAEAPAPPPAPAHDLKQQPSAAPLAASMLQPMALVLPEPDPAPPPLLRMAMAPPPPPPASALDLKHQPSATTLAASMLRPMALVLPEPVPAPPPLLRMAMAPPLPPPAGRPLGPLRPARPRPRGIRAAGRIGHPTAVVPQGDETLLFIEQGARRSPANDLARLMFWNVRHLSTGSPAEKRNAITSKLAEVRPDLCMFCEVEHTVATATDPTVWAPSGDFGEAKQPRPLKYLVSSHMADPFSHPHHLDIVEPVLTPEVRKAYPSIKPLKPWHRRPGYVRFRGLHVYMIHSIASAKAAVRENAMLLGWLMEQHPLEPWLLLGDMNFTPEDKEDYDGELKGGSPRLRNALARLFESCRLALPVMSTHDSHQSLDFAYTNVLGARLTVVGRVGLRGNPSDHVAIVVELPYTIDAEGLRWAVRRLEFPDA